MKLMESNSKGVEVSGRSQSEPPPSYFIDRRETIEAVDTKRNYVQVGDSSSRAYSLVAKEYDAHAGPDATTQYEADKSLKRGDARR